MNRLEQLGPWPARALWIALALVSGPALDDAVGGRSTPVQLVVLIGLSVWWFAGFVALLVPRSTALTALRIVVPGGLAAAIATALAGPTVDTTDAVVVAIAALATLAVLVPWIGDAWVDGSSYGAERRLLLRPPVLFSTFLVPVAWLLVVVGISLGPLLLASGQWITGLLALIVGWAVAAAGSRSLHQLSRRWVVLVPTGLVIHDSLTMPEPQLILRRMITRLGPALADTKADDLTAGASGLALQLDLAEPVDLLLRDGNRATKTKATASLLFTPTRPKHLLDAASAQRIHIG